MIKNILIENFKSIKKVKLQCSELNLFIGTNSSGKSTINQAILFVAQNIERTTGLNGELIKLGDFEENRCVYSSEKTIRIAIADEQDNAVSKRILRKEDSAMLQLETVYNSDLDEDGWKECLGIKERKIQYLSCHRIGPENLYKKNMNLEETIGINGEYAIAYLDTHGSETVPSNLRKDFSDFTLLGQVNWWLKYIVGTEISTEEISGADMVRASYRMGALTKIRPVNIGSGISYLISILVMCLSAPERGVMVIENPEIHLHPAAQAKVCEFLYFIACSGRQLFVETHSDHIFNGFRVGVSTGEMNKEKVNIQFVSVNDEYVTETMKVEIGKYGNILNQREGLFDQFDIDLNRMIGL